MLTNAGDGTPRPGDSARAILAERRTANGNGELLADGIKTESSP